MLRKILSRLLQFVLVLLCVSFITFLLMYLSPSDAADMLVLKQGDSVSEEVIEAMREEMGLNDPFFVQYTRWLGNILHGDFGTSFKNGHAVVDDVWAKFRYTLLLASCAFAIVVLLSLPLGILSAIFHNRIPDLAIQIFSFIMISIPNFVLALLLIYFLAVRAGLLPIVSAINPTGMLMPLLAMSMHMVGNYTRQIRASLLEEMNKPYVIGLKVRGVPRKIIMLHNVLPNSMTSVITLLGITAGSLLSGTAIIELIFSYPGVGRFALEAISYKDYPVIQAYVLLVSVVFILINLTADIIVYLMNPSERSRSVA